MFPADAAGAYFRPCVRPPPLPPSDLWGSILSRALSLSLFLSIAAATPKDESQCHLTPRWAREGEAEDDDGRGRAWVRYRGGIVS